MLEVYFLCLTHGFKGMYIDLKGMEERKSLMDQLASELKQGMPGDAIQLSPSWKPPDTVPALVRSVPTWLTGTVLSSSAMTAPFSWRNSWRSSSLSGRSTTRPSRSRRTAPEAKLGAYARAAGRCRSGTA